MFVATSFSSRAGVSKCGARFETLLRVPTQWCAERFWGAYQSAVIEIGDVTKTLSSGDFNGQRR